MKIVCLMVMVDGSQEIRCIFIEQVSLVLTENTVDGVYHGGLPSLWRNVSTSSRIYR